MDHLAEKLQREGKIALLQKEVQELEIRIRNRQNAIRLATSTTLRLAELEARVPALQEAVTSYVIAFQTLAAVRMHLAQLEEER